MHSTVALKINSEFECGPLGGTRIAGAAAKASSAPAFPKFLEKEIAARPAQVLAFNSPKLRGSRISKVKRDRDFQAVEAFVVVSYVLPLDGTRRVLASLRVGDGQSRVNLRERLIAQAEEFFVLMVNACREDMFPLIRTH